MVHGLGASSESLDPLSEILARRSLTLVCDLPGFGLTRADEVWDVPRIADGLAEFLERRGLGRVTLIGHSWGCHVAALFAGRHPEHVGALVMLSPTFDGRRGGAIGQAMRLAADAPRERPSLVLGGARDYLRAGAARLVVTLSEAEKIPLDDLVAGVTAPVLIVRGGRDPLATGRWAARLADRADRAWVAVVPGAAHGLGHDAPGPVAAAIRAFLDREA